MTKERLVFFVLLRVCVCHCVFIYLGIPRYNQERKPPRSIAVTIQTQTTHIRTQKRNCIHLCNTRAAQNATQYMHYYLKNSQLLIHYRNVQKVIYQFVNKDNRQSPDIDAFSHTPLGILENHTLTMNSAKDTLSNRSSRT